MRDKLEKIQYLIHSCLEEDRNNPSWDLLLLQHLAKLEYHASKALENADEADPLLLTRETIRQFKAVK